VITERKKSIPDIMLNINSTPLLYWKKDMTKYLYYSKITVLFLTVKTRSFKTRLKALFNTFLSISCPATRIDVHYNCGLPASQTVLKDAVEKILENRAKKYILHFGQR
jgi:hypothetical protein